MDPICQCKLQTFAISNFLIYGLSLLLPLLKHFGNTVVTTFSWVAFSIFSPDWMLLLDWTPSSLPCIHIHPHTYLHIIKRSKHLQPKTNFPFTKSSWKENASRRRLSENMEMEKQSTKKEKLSKRLIQIKNKKEERKKKKKFDSPITSYSFIIQTNL